MGRTKTVEKRSRINGQRREERGIGCIYEKNADIRERLKKKEGEGGEGEKSKGKKRIERRERDKGRYIVWVWTRMLACSLGRREGRESEEKRKGKEESAEEGGGEVVVSREIQRNMEKVRERGRSERKTKNLYERVVEYFWTVGKKKRYICTRPKVITLYESNGWDRDRDRHWHWHLRYISYLSLSLFLSRTNRF